MAKLKIFFLLLFSFPVRAETDQSLVLHWLKDFSNKVCKIEVANKESVSRILQLVQKDILHTNFEKEGHKTTFAIIHRMWGEIIVWKIQNSHLRSRIEIQINSRSSSGGRPRYFLRQNSKCEVILAREFVYSPDGRLSRLNHLNKFLNKVKITEQLNPLVPVWENSAKVRVAHVDSGINYLLEGFFQRLARDPLGNLVGWDFWEEDAFPFDLNFSRSPFFPVRHGTAVASIFLREAPNASIAPYRYPRKSMAKFSRVVDAIVNDKAVIVMLPMGSRTQKDWLEFEERARVNPQVLFIVSAGNDGINIDENPIFPASFELNNMIVVTSSDSFGRLASGSNWGKKNVDLMVPAERIPVIDHRGVRVKASGSSYAVPRVAALAARLKLKHPGWKIERIKEEIFNLAVRPRTRGPKRVRIGWIPNPSEDS